MSLHSPVVISGNFSSSLDEQDRVAVHRYVGFNIMQIRTTHKQRQKASGFFSVVVVVLLYFFSFVANSRLAFGERGPSGTIQFGRAR